MSAVVGFDLTDEYSTEDEGKGHHNHADYKAGSGEEVRAMVRGEFFGVFVQDFGDHLLFVDE